MANPPPPTLITEGHRRLRNGNDNSGVEGRLRAVEVLLARIDERTQHLATRAWVLAGVVGGMGLATTLVLSILKLFGD